MTDDRHKLDFMIQSDLSIPNESKQENDLYKHQKMIDRRGKMLLEKTREEFVKGLRIIIKEGYSSQTVTKYAFNFYLNHKLSDKELYDLVYEIMMIDAGPEFELSEIELIKLVEDKLGVNIGDTQEE